ncbi:MULTISPECIES: glycerophosphoryl diester phosphodiesterase membrane domain-containing protein [Streptomyces]|uniref:DUF7847 domain-containing protein n=1 Tax=Streptomyces odorifer TaxID=53450 RepID=A0A7Y6C9X8_9ACTN|nr:MULTISPECIES: glycerophosphoryl diester phosphodiesterase membrane domain-containing protein [Streptomyces]NUV29107.1 hypothetical protein [Streptomyces odorifer]NUV35630.1 hypothetical protein [Streptomyces sp. KAI-27]NUV45562.1 hypothetical protein [Streptomyces sp. CAI-78]
MTYGQPGPGPGGQGGGQGPGQPGGPGWGPPPPPPWGWGWPPPAPKPGVIPLRPLQAGDIFGGVFATMRRYPGGLFGVAAVLHGGYLVVAAGALFAGYLTQRETIDRLLDSSAARPPRGSELTSVLLSFGLIWFLVVALGLVVNAAVAVACTTVTREAVLGRPARFGQVLRSVKRFPTVVGIQLLSGLIVAIPVGLMFLFLVLTMAALLSQGDVGPWLVLMPFLILCAAPLAVWLLIRLALATPAAVFEGQRPVGALRRSVRLVRDNWWRTFGLLLLAGLMAMGLNLAVQILTEVFQSPTHPLVVDPATERFGSAEVRALFADALGATAIGFVVLSLVQIATMTLTHLTAALVYVDLRIRKEGLADALIGEVRQGAPGPQTPPATGQGG